MTGLADIAGNPAAKRLLESGRGLSHAYLLAGPAGCGKRTLAGLLSAALVCSGEERARPCGRCADCRKARGGVHPDIIRVGDDGKDVNVAKVRALRGDAYIRPNEAARKVYVVENAQTMNASAQNALLKLLEDGPAYAAFLLITDNAGALLETVRSRCESITLAPVTPAEAEAFLLGRFPALPPDRVRDAARRCEGVLGRAVRWLEGGGEEDGHGRAEAVKLKSLLLGKNELALLEYCVTLEGMDRESLSALLDEAVQQLRAGLSAGDAPKKSLALIQTLKELRTALDFNAGPGHVAGRLCAQAFTQSGADTQINAPRR